MDRQTLIRSLMATFLQELDDHLRTLNEETLALERDPGAADRAGRLNVLFRAAHSIKGASRSVGVVPIEEACHRLESILSDLRDGRITPGPDLYSLLFQTYDALEESAMRLREEQDLAGSPLESLLPSLDAASSGSVPPATQARPGPPPTSTPTTADVAKSPEAPPPSPSPRPREVGPEKPPPAAQGSVRLPAEKLDAMLARSGELLVARQRLEGRTDDLATLRDDLATWRADWRLAAKPLGRALSRADTHASPEIGPLPGRVARALARGGDHLARLERDVERLAVELAVDTRRLDRAALLLDEQVRQARMLPFVEACQGLDRAVRDVAHSVGKQAVLSIEGGEVGLDRAVLEGLRDPLLHLVRNAVDHGLEDPESRRKAGKPPTGRVSVSATLRGAQVEVVVADDGRGLDLDQLRLQALRHGMAEPPSPRDLAQLIFHPGLTTAPALTSISGRGVGLDVVKDRLEQLHGTIDVSWEPGRGVRISLAVPLTLTTFRALLLRAGGQIFALASTNVDRLVQAGPDAIRRVGGRDVLPLGGAALPVANLADVLGLPEAPMTRAGGKLRAVIAAAGERRMGFFVDELLAEQEVMIKALGPRIRRVRNFSGATILPSGRIAMLLNAAGLIRSATGCSVPAIRDRPDPAAPAKARARLLVVDDSVTTRTLAKSILEAASYDVITAVDGEDAWRRLEEGGVDLLISDVEMPRMDGLALTEAVRGSSRFARLPVILFTSRASDRDRARGAEVGADDYIVKAAFDQRELLASIAQLL